MEVPKKVAWFLFLVLFLFLFSGRSEATTKYWIGSSDGNFNDDTRWSTSSGGANNTTAPGASDVATFDTGGTGNCTITVSASVGGIDIKATYPSDKTVRQNSLVDVFVGSSNFSQAGGNFTGGDWAIDINGNFTLSGGIFTSTSGTLSISGNFTHTGGGTFNHGNGWVGFDGGAATIDVATSEIFHDLGIAGSNGTIKTVANNDTLIVTNTLTLTEGSVNQSTIPANGTINLQVDDGTEDLVLGSAFDGGTGTLLISGNGTKTLTTLPGGAIMGINLNAANVTLNGPSLSPLTLEGTTNSLTIQAGTFNGGVEAITVNLAYNQSGGTFNGSTNPAGWGLTVTGSFSLNGGTFNGGCYATFSSSVSASGGSMNGGDHTMTFNGAATFSGATVNGGSADWDFNSTFTLSAGTFTASSGWSRFANDFTHTAGGTFSHGNGTVIFEGGSTAINVVTSETFYNLTINGNHNTTKTVAASDTLIVTNTLTLTEGSVNQGTIPAGGTINLQVDDGTEDLIVAATFDGGTGTLLISGNGSKTLSTLAGGRMMGITLNAANVTLNGPDSGTLTLEGTTNSLNIQAGTFNGGAGAIRLNLAYTQSGGTFTGGAGTVTVTGAFNLSGGTFTGDAHTTLSTTASASGGTLNGGSTFGYLDFNGAATFSGATVNGQTGYFTFFSSFTLSSGSFTASSNNPIVFYGNFTHTAGGTFTPNNGLVYFAGSDTTIDVAGSEIFYDVDVIQTTYLRLANGDTIVINGTLTLSNGAIIASGPAETATIDAKGPVSVESTFDGGYSTTQYLATLLIDGTGTQSVALAAGAAMPKTTLNNSLITVSFSGAGTITWEADFTLQAGTVTGGDPAITFNGAYTQSGGTFGGGAGTVTVTGVFSLGGGTFTGGTTTTLNGNMTISAGTFNGGTTVNFGNAAGDTFGFSGTGILNVGSGTVTFNATPTFSGGTFNGNSGTLGFNTAFTLSGGTFTASSGTTSFAGAFTHTAGGSFSHNNGTAAFTGGNANIDVTTSEIFYNLTINGTNATAKTVANSDTLIVTNTLTLTEASVNQATIPAGGTINLQVDEGTEDLVVAATFDGGTGTLLITGNGSKTLTTLAAGQMMGINLNAANVTLNGPDSGTLTLEGTTNSLTIQAGTFNGVGVITVTLAYNQSGGTFTGGSGLITFSSTVTASSGTFNGGLGYGSFSFSGAATFSGATVSGQTPSWNFNSSFTLSGGSFTASSVSTTTFYGNFTHTDGGTFSHNNGTAAFAGGATNIDVTISETFYNLTINGTNGTIKTVANSDTLIVTNTLALTEASVNQATIPASGTINLQVDEGAEDLVVAATFDGGTGTLLISGNGTKVLTTLAAGQMMRINLNAPNVTLTGPGSGTLTLEGTTNSLTIQAGTFNGGAGAITVSLAYAQSGGTFTGGAGTVTVTGAFDMSSGTFTGGTTTTFSSTFTLSGGAFTASTGTTTFASTFTHIAGGTFAHGGGTAAFTGSSASIDVATSETFSSLTINSSGTITVADNDTLVVNGTLTLTNGSINQTTIPATGTIAARGAVTQANTFDGGTGKIVIDGSGAQTFTGGGSTSAGTLPDIEINKSGGGTLTLSSTIRTTNDWIYTVGAIDATTNDSTLVFAGTLSISGTHTLDNVTLNGSGQNVTFASGTLSVSSLTVGTAVDQSTTFTVNGTVSVSSALLYVNRDFTIGGSGTLQAQNDMKITREGSNNHTTTTVNNGTTLSIAGSLTLGENDTSTGEGILQADGTVTVAGTLYLYRASINGTGSVAARGDITQTTKFNAGTGKIVIDGSGSQTLTGGGSGALLVAIEINKSLGGTLTLSGTIGTSKNWTYLAGTIDGGTSTVVFGAAVNSATLTITGSHTLNNVTLNTNSGNVIVANGTTLNVSTLGLTAAQTMTFTVNGSVVASGTLTIDGNFTISGTGALTNQGNVTIRNQSSSAASTITVSQGTTFNMGAGLTITSADGDPEASFAVNGTAVVSGTLTLTDGTINGTGILSARGNISQASTFNGGTGRILIDGTVGQTFTGCGSATTGTLPDIEINKSDTLTLSSIIRTTNDWTYTAGTLDAGSSTVVFAATLNVTGSHALNSVDIRGATTIAGGDLTVNGTLTLTSNNITTGSNTLALGGSATISRTSGHVIGNLKKTYGSTGSFTFTVGTANGYSPVDVNVTASPGDFTVKATQGCHPDIDTCNQALQRYWTLTASGPTADLTFHYLQGDVQGTEANYLISKYTIGSGWSFPAGSLDTVNNLASISGVSSFSDWTLAENRAPTAVRLASFTAGGYGDGVLIQWKTGYEVDNLGFHIYREVGSHRLRLTPELVAGSALLIGTGTPLTAGYSYSWWDPRSGWGDGESGPVRYWLEDLDLNGKRTWHGPVEIQWSDITGQGSYVSTQSSSEQKFSMPLSKVGKGSSAHPLSNPAPSRGMAGVGLPSPEQLKKQWALAEKAGIKIGVKEAGWYRVRQQELVAAGLDPNINPRRLQLFVNGKERPILVAGEEDGRFNPEDSIEFYGTGLDTPSTDTQVYWLVVGLRPGKRMNPPRPSLGGEEEGLGRGRPVSFPFTIDSRERTFYFAALKNGDDENFFGPLITAEPVDRTLILQHLDPSAPEMASLEIGLQGMTAQPHHVRVLLNNVEVGEVSFDGQDHTIARIPFPQSGLLEGENLLTWVAENGETDVSLLDYLRLTYRHTYTADHDALRFTARGGDQLEIGGFTNPAIRVIDITRSKSVREIRGVVDAAGDAYEIKVTIPGSGERDLLAFTEDRVEQPALITANQPSGWHRKREKADLVIISHGNFLESLTPLKTLREEQGYSVALIDVEDLYDEFSFGIKSPWAMKDFLTAAKKRWQRPPRYVLLVGDASFDPRNYLGLGEFDFVPTKQIATAYLETASDDWFVDLNGDGLAEMAVGRLPVRTAEEAGTVVSKIIGYEQIERGPWAGQALMVADRNHGFDFEGAIEEVGSLLPEQMTTWEIMVGQSGEEAARTSLLTGIHEGQLLVNYMGHGSVEVWNGDLLTSDDAVSLDNGFRLPFFVIMTCLNGLFHDVYTESLSETLLKAPGGGALAVWASSGLTEPAWQVVINKELIRLLFEGKSLTLGEATKGAKAAVSDHDTRSTWILFGDPTTKLK